MTYQPHNNNQHNPQRPDLFEKIKELKAQGLNPNKIAIALNVPPNTIYNYIRRYGTDDSQTFNVNQYDNWLI